MAKTGKNGRSKERYFAIPHYIMNTVAWKQLSVTARAAWLEISRIHNGANNGKLAMSTRILGERLGLSKSAAARSIQDLITYGFIEIARSSSFSGKRRATEYRLTHLKDDITGELPSRAFQNIGKISPNSNDLACDKPSTHSFYSSTSGTT
jgi:hypothetical protein